MQAGSRTIGRGSWHMAAPCRSKSLHSTTRTVTTAAAAARVHEDHHRSNNVLTAAFEHCRHTIRQYDNEQYLCSLSVDKVDAHVNWALRAFNVEMSRLQSVAKGNLASELRFKYWEALLDDIGDREMTDTPLSTALSYCVHRVEPVERRIRVQYLKRMFRERVKDIRNQVVLNSMDDLAQYQRLTHGQVIQCLLHPMHSVLVDHALEHATVGIGLAMVLRGLPYQISHKKLYLPLQLLAKHKVVYEELRRGIVSHHDAFTSLCYEIANEAHSQLSFLQDHWKDLPVRAQQILLCVTPAQLYLQQLEKVHFDPLHPTLLHLNFRTGLMWRLWRQKWW